MAKINQLGNITASCHGCGGSTSTFEHVYQGHEVGVTTTKRFWTPPPGSWPREVEAQYRLLRCAGCGMGALACIRMSREHAVYPDDIDKLLWFMPEAKERLSLPEAVPEGLVREFREGEKCKENGTLRAAAGMFRSVLDKTLRANGYKTNPRTDLKVQIDEATKDGVITVSRQRKAHEEIRVLGNDVLHDEWHEIPEDDVEAARHYMQRILEDFYDDRESVLSLLREAKRVPDEDKQAKEGE